MSRQLPRILVLLVLLGVALRVFTLGYLPPDDALRHAGKAMTERSWHEILVMREGVYAAMDSHPGWHTVLGAVHHRLGFEGEALVRFSVFILFLAATLPPVFLWPKSQPYGPYAWLFILALAVWLEPGSFLRLFLGRPLLFTMGVALSLLLLWQREDGVRPARSTLATIVPLVALAVWCHSTWYLFALPLVAFWMVGPWRRAAWFSVAVVCGIVVGAILTGHPVDYLFYQLKHLYWTMLEPGAGAGLAGELRRYHGTHYLAAGGVAVLALALWRERKSPLNVLRSPALLLAIVCLGLSFKATRFWVDWGYPCLSLWLAGEVVLWMDRVRFSVALKGAALLGAATLVLGAGIGHYRSYFLQNPPQDLATSLLQDPQTAAWLPGQDGIVYSTDMRVFYTTLFLFPETSWRYAPGFEPGLMPQEDAHLYRAWRENHDPAALCAWASKLRPNDRLAMVSPSNQPPPACGLQWHFWAPYYWIGKR